MHPKEKKPYECPSCHCIYRLREAHKGKIVSCKQCGSKFEIIFDEPSAQVNSLDDGDATQQVSEKLLDTKSLLVLGKLAIKHNLITEEQLNEVLSFQKQKKKEGQELWLGDTLVMQGIISKEQLDFLLLVQSMRQARDVDIRFGAIAVRDGLVTKEEVKRALEKQRQIFSETKTIVRVGNILVESGRMTRDEHDAVLSRQRHLKKLSTERAEDNGTPNILAHDAPFELTVAQDGLEVYICPKGKIPAEVTVETVKKLLEAQGIKYGIVDDTVIAHYMKEENCQGKPLKIAQGEAPEDNQDSVVKYYFETDPQKIGEVKEDGAIDFKDRGEIPQATKGDLIAEKIPSRDGSPGVDVFGNPIPVKKQKDIKMRCGKGAQLSEDRLRVFASLDGLPQVSVDGRISVLPELKISGDIGLETGHVDFDGDITVSGSVQEGFRVKGKRLSAKEIINARIDITGDVVVFGGIIGAHIKAGGNVKAMYVRGATIQALGDVVIDKECFDSTIESSSACIVNRGKICSSSIMAKNGIEANDIGSDSSEECDLVIGIDERVKKKIEKIQKQIMLREIVQENRKARIGQLQEDSKNAAKAVGEMAQVTDRLMVKQRALKEQAEAFKKAENHEQLTNAEMLVKNLDSKIREAEQALEKLFSTQDGDASKIEAFEEKIKNGEERIEELLDEVEAITEWSASGKPMPTVKVHNMIYSGTTIRGLYSSLVIRGNCRNSLIREAKVSEPDSKIRWKMLVTILT